MSKKFLILGRLDSVVADAKQFARPDLEVFRGTSVEDMRSTFARTNIDHVIMGAGIDLEIRLQIIREIFQLSETTTVHMKDRASGPQGFMPFIHAVLRGLVDDEG